MNTWVILSIIFAVMGFIATNIITYKSFGGLDFWEVVIFGLLGACAGVLIGVGVVMVGVAIVF